VRDAFVIASYGPEMLDRLPAGMPGFISQGVCRGGVGLALQMSCCCQKIFNVHQGMNSLSN
jgi:hypothetical protein